VFSDTSISPFLHVAYVFTILYNTTYVYIYIQYYNIIYVYNIIYIHMHVYDIGEGGEAERMARLARLPWSFTRPFWAFAFSLAL
jgi:hypothetical protein